MAFIFSASWTREKGDWPFWVRDLPLSMGLSTHFLNLLLLHRIDYIVLYNYITPCKDVYIAYVQFYHAYLLVYFYHLFTCLSSICIYLSSIYHLPTCSSTLTEAYIFLCPKCFHIFREKYDVWFLIRVEIIMCPVNEFSGSHHTVSLLRIGTE